MYRDSHRRASQRGGRAEFLWDSWAGSSMGFHFLGRETPYIHQTSTGRVKAMLKHRKKGHAHPCMEGQAGHPIAQSSLTLLL